MFLDKTKLTIVMARNNINFSALAKLSHVSRPTLSAINNGKSCNITTAGKIAKALGVDVTEILED